MANAPEDDARTFGVDSDATGDHLQAYGYLSKTFCYVDGRNCVRGKKMDSGYGGGCL
jgi:hypothetical protein